MLLGRCLLLLLLVYFVSISNFVGYESTKVSGFMVPVI